jgi:hypothetical protein
MMKKFLLVTIVMLLSAVFALAQTTGSISGAVADPNGAVVAGATVKVTNTATGIERSATSNKDGLFNFEALQPGVYRVLVEMSGFKKAVATDISVAVASTAQINVTLEVGLANETVTVTTAQETINTSSPSLTNVIDTRQVKDLPLPTRNPLDLAALQAGIAVVGTDTRGSSVGGLRQTATNVTQDGINAMDNFVKTSSFFAISAPSLNSTAEFSITTGTVGSEQGRGVAQVNLVTKGGSNEFHGGIFYLHRNDALNANTFFSNSSGTNATTGKPVSPRARQRQHFFGFDVGGPVYFPAFGEGGPKIFNGKDTAFWFFSYEGFRENFSVTRNRTVLTPEARAGTFRYTGTNGALQTVNLLTIGNVGIINPITKTLIDSTPLPNNTLVGDGFNTAGYQFGVSGADVNNKYVARYDHHLVKNSRLGSHKFEFVFNRSDFSLSPDTFNGLEAPFPGGVNAFQPSKRWLVTGALVSTFGANVTNVVRYGRQWAPVGFLREEGYTSGTFIFFSGITNPQNTFDSQGRNTIVNQFKDDLSWSKGNHLFRFGADFQQVFADTFNDLGINQGITLGRNTANETGIVLADLPFGVDADVTRATAVYANIVGNLASSSATFNVLSPTSGFVLGATRSRIFKQRDLALYAQDQWRFRTNLTLNFGVRWEYQGVPTIPNGLAIQPDPDEIFGVSGFGNLFKPTAAAGVPSTVVNLNFVSGDTGKGLYKNDWNNFAPFIGVAYSPNFENGFLKTIFGEQGKSSIRAGYSISYLRDGFTVISNALGTGVTNPGLIQTAANTTPTGVLTAAGVPLTTPTFQIPISDRTNNLINPGNALWAIDENLVVPYVQQWSIGFEREIAPNTAIEIRYQGNHAVKVWRANDFNEVNIFENGFLAEYLKAQSNLAICQANGTACRDAQALAGVAAATQTSSSFANWGLTGQVALPILDKFFTGTTAFRATQFANSGFVGNLTGNNVGTFASTLATSNTYRTNRENPALGIPFNFFMANPNAAFIRLLTNDSMSNYHALQIELRRRFLNGFQFQADYTFSKSLSDAADAQGNNQSDLVSFRTLRDKSLDYRRSNFDQTHRFVTNAIYELPFGRGKQFFNSNSVVNYLMGGWTLGGILTWATRPPFFIASGRATFNNFNAGLNPAQLVGITFEEFKNNIGVFRRPEGVYFINPDLLTITTNATTGRYISSTLKPGLLGSPAPGSFGNFPMNSLNGPNFFNIDMSLTKRIPIKERVTLELKTTFINILNHPSFIFNTQNFDSTSFGLINSTSGSQRIIHFTGGVRF